VRALLVGSWRHLAVQDRFHALAFPCACPLADRLAASMPIAHLNQAYPNHVLRQADIHQPI